jgi:hypothetical protein
MAETICEKDTMPPASRRLRLSALASVLATASALAISPAWSADAPPPSPEQAQQFEDQLRDWIAGLIGPGVTVPERPVQLTAQDGGYAVAVPLAGAFADLGLTLEADPITAVARPLPDGRWALDEIRLPSPLRVVLGHPGKQTESSTTVTLEEQDQHVVFDPEFATTSTLDSSIGGYRTQSQGPDGESSTSIAHLVTHITAQPSGEGLVDVTEEANSDLLATNARISKVGQTSLSAAHSRLIAHIDALRPARVVPMLHAVSQFIPMLAAAARQASLNGEAVKPPGAMKRGAAKAAPPSLTAEQRASLREAAVALTQLTAGFGEEGTLDDVHVSVLGVTASVQKMTAGMALSAPAGRLLYTMRIACEGFDSPAIPAGPLRDFVPHRVTFAPRVGGVGADQVGKLLLAAIDTDGNDAVLAPQGRALLHDGPLVIGLDEVSADVGPASLKAEGEMRIAGENDVQGEARITVTGMEALLHSAQAVPEIGPALPALIFLKGIGRTDGDTTVWRVAYHDKRLTVNGTDMSKMMPK